MSFPLRQYNIILNVNSEFNQPPLRVKKDDTQSTIFNIQLLNNFSAIDITGLTVKFTVRKSDGTIVFQTPDVIDADAGKIAVTLTAQTLAVAGIADAEVSLYDGGGAKLTMFEFSFDVDDNIDPTGAIESSDDLPALTELIAHDHTHANKTAIDKVPDTGTGNTGKVLTVHADGTMQWDFLSGSDADVTQLSIKVDEMYVIKHTHTNKATLDLIPTHSGVTEGYILKKGAGDTLTWSAEAGGATAEDVQALADRVSAVEADDITQDNRLTGVEGTNATQAGQISALQSGKADTSHTHASLYPDKTTTENHILNTNNPHSVTKAQVGLSLVDNTSDANKPISNATQSALDTINGSISTLQSGKANTAHTHETADVNGLDGALTTFTNNFTNTFIGSNIRGSQSVEDLNAVVKSGAYYSSDMTNNPVNKNGYVVHTQVPDTDDYASQIFVEFDADNAYMRRKEAGVWKSWVQIAGATPPPLVKYTFSNFTAVAGQENDSTFPVGIPYDVAKDTISVYINGLKLIKGKNFTVAYDTVTLLNSRTLDLDDDVLVEVLTNSL